jgi:hypothetical protein
MESSFEKGFEKKSSQKFFNGRLEAGEKPDIFARKIELLVDVTFSKVETIGKENLDSIPADRKVIFATTHITNSDVPLALSVLGKEFHLSVGDASTHRNITENPFAFIGTELAGGEKNFISVSHRKDAKTGETGVFNPDDFEKMQNVFNENKAVILSAYYKDQNKNLELPERGGYGAAYLAEIADAIIVPVAIDIKSEEHVNTVLSSIKATLSRPEAKVIIGKPFELQKSENVSALKEIMNKRKQGIKLSSNEILLFNEASQELRGQSDILMQHLAELLPEEKRGEWNQKNT